MDILIPAEIIALLEEPSLQTPVIVLHTRELNKVLPIWIGPTEARNIGNIMQGVQNERPLTHDLILMMVYAMSGKINKVVINRMEGTTFYAIIEMSQGERKIEIDSRPSDAVAIALKARVPIFITRELMEKEGQKNPFETTRTTRIQEKKEFTAEELQKMTEMLAEAQKREQQQ
ncbi:MAG: bifunctional nuclease family protein [Patescibacteria group bacterium]